MTRPRRPAVLRRWAAVSLVALVALVVLALLPVWQVLRVSSDEDVLAELRLGGDHITISYVHSIDRLPIEEDIEIRGDHLVTTTTRLRQFGAGMGHRPGEGRAYGDGQWWVIDDMDRDLGPELLIRVGQPRIDHQLRTGDVVLYLSGCLPGQRVRLEPASISTIDLLLGSTSACQHPPEKAEGSEEP